MDWTEDTGLHQQFKDWREEVELLIDMVLSTLEIRKPNSSMSVYGLEKKQEHILSTVSEDNKDSLGIMMDTHKTGPNSKLQHSHTSEL